MEHLLAMLLFVANAITCARLLLYRRDGARYRPMVSAAAWLLILSSGSTALWLVLGLYPVTSLHLADAGRDIVLCLLSLTARGNVAAILRTDHDD